ncbi:MAG: type 4a pilus biogenesis protein PilO [Planctomycetota bacterium]|nr:type 4a pilus biogenesis protein PilO [Planctomycetota bacterium]MDI6786808.1 type 4a pilus biogenesis protein PilO [Planctomycetota bacterium]
MKLSEKQLFILTIIIPAIIAVILSAVGYFVFYNQSSRLKKNIVDTANKIKQANDKKIEMAKLEERLTELEGKTKSLEEALPTKEEIAYEKFIDTFTKLGQEAGVQLTSAVPDEGKSGAPQQIPTSFDKISYNLKIEGDFEQVISFIYLVETYQRFIKVNKFAVRPAMGADKTIRYGLDISLTTYVYKPPK